MIKKWVYILVIVAIVCIVIAITLFIVLYKPKQGDNKTGKALLPNLTYYWSHKTEDSWPGMCLTGKRQSPIALYNHAAIRGELEPIRIKNLQKCDCLALKNDGHSVKIFFDEKCKCPVPLLSGSQLHETYIFDHMHFHWPSEHTIDGVTYPLEAHLLFYVGTLSHEKAVTFPYGVVVMGVLYNKVVSPWRGTHFKTIAKAVEKVAKIRPQHSSSYAKINIELNLGDLLPKNLDEFFTYEGSKTTPKCDEIVKWIVLNSHPTISHKDFSKLTRIYDNNDELLIKNTRHLQDTNNRLIVMRKP